MKIIILCGCLEPGRDGVGDYSRLLGRELTTMGHEIFLFAINDKYATPSDQNSAAYSVGTNHVLRLSSSKTWKERMHVISNHINIIGPDWISLQYVPFAFHDKGLPILLSRNLKKVCAGVKWHMMFHELWVGNEQFKFKVLGRIQRFMIQKMLHQINPEVVHTHLPIYFKDLSSLDIKVKELPLFSNFPEDEIAAIGGTDLFRIVFFNQVSDDYRVLDFVTALSKKAVENNLKFEVVLIGILKGELERFAEKLKTLPCLDDKVKWLGFVEGASVAGILKSCSLGISPLRLSTLGKSGTTAAFLTQGLPIAIPIQDKVDEPFFYPELMDALVFQPDFDKIQKASDAAKDLKKLLSVKSIAEKFIKDLTYFN